MLFEGKPRYLRTHPQMHGIQPSIFAIAMRPSFRLAFVHLLLAARTDAFPGSASDQQLLACSGGNCPAMHGQIPQLGNALNAAGKANGGTCANSSRTSRKRSTCAFCPRRPGLQSGALTVLHPPWRRQPWRDDRPHKLGRRAVLPRRVRQRRPDPAQRQPGHGSHGTTDWHARPARHPRCRPKSDHI